MLPKLPEGGGVLSLKYWQFVPFNFMCYTFGGLDFPRGGVSVAPFGTDCYVMRGDGLVANPLRNKLLCAAVRSCNVEVANACLPSLVDSDPLFALCSSAAASLADTARCRIVHWRRVQAKKYPVGICPDDAGIRNYITPKEKCFETCKKHNET